MLKVYVVWGSSYDSQWMAPLGIETTKNFDEAHIVLFTGGVADVNPQFYGESVGSNTYVVESRCKEEVQYFDKALSQKKLMVGICRGAQLICALSGGKLIQHVNNHYSGVHMVSCIDGSNYKMNSLHHQMQFPFDMSENSFKLIAWTNRLSTHHLNGDDEDYALPADFKEPEVVRYLKTRGLGYQGHPEMLAEGSQALTKCREFLRDFINETLGLNITLNDNFTVEADCKEVV